jgi:hypothetical protein
VVKTIELYGSGVEGVEAAIDIYGRAFIATWLATQQAARMVIGDFLTYIGETGTTRLIKPMLDNKNLWDLSDGLQRIMDDDKAKDGFLKHRFPQDGKRYDVPDSLRVFLESWNKYGAKPRVEIHSPADKWYWHIHINPNEEGIHFIVTKDAYNYIKWLFFRKDE